MEMTLFRVYEGGSVVHEDDCEEIDRLVDAGCCPEELYTVHEVPTVIVKHLLPDMLKEQSSL